MKAATTLPQSQVVGTDSDISKEVQPVQIPPVEINTSTDSGEIVFISTETSRTRTMPRYFQPEQSWEGEVTDVLQDTFRARLVDMNDPVAIEDAEIYFSSVTDQDDLKLIKKGAIFFWAIGTRIERRRREQVSIIQFRRLPRWTQKELSESGKQAKENYDKLNWQS